MSEEGDNYGLASAQEQLRPKQRMSGGLNRGESSFSLTRNAEGAGVEPRASNVQGRQWLWPKAINAEARARDGQNRQPVAGP